MDNPFGRKYQLWIAPSRDLVRVSEVDKNIAAEIVVTSEDFNSGKILFKDAVDWLSVPLAELDDDHPVDTLVISKLHMVAKATYGKGKSGSMDQNFTIDLYNLPSSDLARIQDESLVILKAGYETDSSLPLICSGQLIHSYTERSGNDMITYLVCKDSYVPIKDKRLSLSFAPGKFTYRQILQELLNQAKKLGIASGVINIPRVSAETLITLRLNREASQGYVVEGSLFESIKALCEQVGLVSYIQLNTLYVEPKSHHPRELLDITTVNKDSVVGIVSPLNNSTTSGVGSKKAPNGVKFKTFLNGRIVLANYVQVITGQEDPPLYEPTKITHTLDYEGTSWFTGVEAMELSNAE